MPADRSNKESRSTNALNHNENDLELVDVVIIGAGWAGLGAANVFLKRGLNNFVVLEAREEVGGRSVTDFDVIPECPVEIGSAWIHGDIRNPVKDLLDEYKLPYGVVSEKSAAVWTSDGSRVDKQQLEAIEKLRARFVSYMERRQYADRKDKNLEDVLQDFLCTQKNLEEGFEGELGLRWALDTKIVQEYAADLSELSLWWWDNDQELNGRDLFLGVPNGGYSTLIHKFAASVLPYVRLGSTVQSIEHGKGINAVVTYTDRTQNRSRSIQAKYVLVTLPLGVLKSGAVRFSPPLPREKRDAIDKLGNGLLNRCVLYWEGMTASDIFWPAEPEWLKKICPRGEQGHWSEFYNAYTANGGTPMLIGFVAGRHARRMEELSDEQVKTEAVASLREMFGHHKVPEPSKVVVVRWGKDAYAQGSYSFLKEGANDSTRKKLGRAVGKQIWFAGEATHELYPSTTHGALMSGEKAAEKILSRMTKVAEKSVLKRVATAAAKGGVAVAASKKDVRMLQGHRK